MVNLAKKTIIYFTGKNFCQVLALAGILSCALTVGSVKPAVGAVSVSGLGTGPILAVDLNAENALLSARPEAYGPPVPPTVQEVLLAVCRERGYDESCAKTLLGMAWKESKFDGQAVGDSGRALGFFQIHYRLHRLSAACAEDLHCSAEWTLSYLETNGYPRYPAYAIQCHNGCNAGNGYAASAERHGRRLWDAAVGNNKAVLAVK